MPIGPMGEPLPYPGDPGYEGEEVEDASSILQQILALADRYRRQEQSQKNLLDVEKLRTIAQQILAAEEKERDDAMQGKLTPSAVRRFAGG